MLENSATPHPPKLLEQVVDRLRVKHYSRVAWIERSEAQQLTRQTLGFVPLPNLRPAVGAQFIVRLNM